MEKKKIIPAIGCRQGRAVVMDGNNQEPYADDIRTTARFFSDHGADSLLICDLSEDDADHEQTIDLLRQITAEIDIPVITGGRVRRLEDVKKYLYAGAKAVFIRVDDEAADLIKEAADRFGKEQICAYLPGRRFLKHMEEYVRLGISAAILDEWLDQDEIAALEPVSVPLLGVFPWTESARIEAFLRLPFSCGAAVAGISAGPEGDCMAWKESLRAKGIPTEMFESAISWSEFKLNSDGLIPVIVQDYRTDEVLMLAYMNGEAFEKTLRTGRMTYYSRSRQTLWTKGETSGHYQFVKALKLDCDKDTILAKVRQIGPACHTGARSCFFTALAEKEYRDTNPLKVFENVFGVIQDRKQHPKEGSYTNYLFDKGIDKILKKIGEEATEIVIAAKNPNPEEIKYEIADFLYHMMVLMADKGISWEEITHELANR